MKRSDLLSLLGGLLLGLAAGVFYSWGINPLAYSETTPDSLRERYRQDYYLLTALSYLKNGDLDRAEERLESFQSENLPADLSRQAQTSLADDRPVIEARALAQLAAALSDPQSIVSAAVTATPTPSPEPTEPLPPTVTPSPAATRAPTSTPGAPYELIAQRDICDPELPAPLLQLYVRDANGDPIPGVEALVFWDGGTDHFFTGLKPELGLDYGDFAMTPGVLYQLELVDGQYPITGLSSGTCMDDTGQSYSGSVELLFQQPTP